MVHDVPSGSRSDADLVDAVQLLHSLATEVAAIAKRLHLSQADTQHIIRHGTLPQRQLMLAWADDADGSPYDGEGNR